MGRLGRLKDFISTFPLLFIACVLFLAIALTVFPAATCDCFNAIRDDRKEIEKRIGTHLQFITRKKDGNDRCDR